MWLENNKKIYNSKINCSPLVILHKGWKHTLCLLTVTPISTYNLLFQHLYVYNVQYNYN